METMFLCMRCRLRQKYIYIYGKKKREDKNSKCVLFNKSDIQIIKSDVQVIKSDIPVIKLDVPVIKSDVQIVK